MSFVISTMSVDVLTIGDNEDVGQECCRDTPSFCDNQGDLPQSLVLSSGVGVAVSDTTPRFWIRGFGVCGPKRSDR